jgi:hypothetical protein
VYVAELSAAERVDCVSPSDIDGARKDENAPDNVGRLDGTRSLSLATTMLNDTLGRDASVAREVCSAIDVNSCDSCISDIELVSTTSYVETNGGNATVVMVAVADGIVRCTELVDVTETKIESSSSVLDGTSAVAVAVTSDDDPSVCVPTNIVAELSGNEPLSSITELVDVAIGSSLRVE